MEDVLRSCKKTGGEGGSVDCIHKWVCCYEPLPKISLLAICQFYFALSIGYSIAKKLAMDGAKVMLSSRRIAHVERAVKQLRSECEGVSVEGVVCHVGNDDHRKNLIKEVS